MPEYCGVISINPTTVGDRARVEEAEKAFDMGVLETALQKASYQRIDEVLNGSESGLENVEIVNTPSVSDIIVDIRHPNEIEEAPLTLTNNTVIEIPFFELEGRVNTLPEAGRYLLYCQKGTMSKIHAHHLNSDGSSRFAVFMEQIKPKTSA